MGEEVKPLMLMEVRQCMKTGEITGLLCDGETIVPLAHDTPFKLVSRTDGLSRADGEKAIDG